MTTPTLDRKTEPRQSLTHRLYTGDIAYNFIGRRKIWYTISAIALLISIAALLIRGLDLGIEFRGGSDFQVPTAVTATSVTDYRDAVLATGVPRLDTQVVPPIGETEVRVKTRSLSVAAQPAVLSRLGTPVASTASR